MRAGIRKAMTDDDRVFLMGEDVGSYGGAYAVSKGLLEEFGAQRIRDTPLCESTFVGAGIGAALAQACAMYDTKCTVFVPEGNNPDKNAAVEALGGELVIKGHDFDAAWDASVRHAWNSGAVSVHPGKRPELVAGQATVALEMLQQAPDKLDVIIVPVGGGSLAGRNTPPCTEKGTPGRYVHDRVAHGEELLRWKRLREEVSQVVNSIRTKGTRIL